jgi:hypothetical protein
VYAHRDPWDLRPWRVDGLMNTTRKGARPGSFPTQGAALRSRPRGRPLVTVRYRSVCIVGRLKVFYVKERRGRAVKKLLLVALAAIGGLLVYRQIQADRAEQDLWTEATDSVPNGS